ncbi:hypothetical protein Tco_1423101 [Tanacetum coccineum]
MDSARGGFNLNNEAGDSKEKEVREVRPMGQDEAKKKASSSFVPSESSIEATTIENGRKHKSVATGPGKKEDPTKAKEIELNR